MNPKTSQGIAFFLDCPIVVVTQKEYLTGVNRKYNLNTVKALIVLLSNTPSYLLLANYK